MDSENKKKLSINLPIVNRHAWEITSRWLLIILSLLLVICAYLTLDSGIKLDTNLRSLSPSFSDDATFNNTLNRLSADASKTLVIVLADEDQDKLDEASEFLQSTIESAKHNNKKNLLHYTDQSEIVDSYVRIVKHHPFAFLGKEAQAALQSADAEKINRLALANLYGNASQIKLIGPEQDPFGFVNEYLVQLVDRLTGNMQMESQQVVYQGKEIYIAPHILRVNVDNFSLAMQSVALQQIHQLVSQVQQEFSDVQVFQTGMIFFAADSAQSAQSDINTISIGSTIGVVLLLLLIFRSIKAFLLPVISIGLGIGFAFFFCHALFGSLHIITIVFGTSLIGVVVDYSLHYFYFCVHQQHCNNNSLVARSALYRALFLSLLSSVVGYAALAASGLKALMQVAAFSAAGLIYAWLFVVVCGQSLAKGVKVYDSTLNRTIESILSLINPVAKTKILLVALCGLVLAIAFGIDRMKVSDSPKSLINANPDLIAQEQQVNAWASSYEPASFILVSGNNAQQVFDRVAYVENKLSVQTDIFPASTSLLGVHQLFPSPAEQQKNYQLNQWLYQSSNSFARDFIQQQDLADVVNLPPMQEAYRNQASTFASPAALFNSKNSLPPLWIEKKSADKSQLLSFMLIPKQANIAKLKQEIKDIEGVTYFSAVEETQSGLQKLRESALLFLVIAVVMIAAILWYQYRMVKTLHLIAIPIISLCGTLLLLMLLNIPLTLFHVMALFLVLGLGMDYVVFVAEMTSANIDSANQGDFFPAIVLSAATNLLSFGLLALSSMPAVNAFGITLFIGCTLNVVGAFWLAAIWRKSFVSPIEN